jgi:hypothetical protein
LHVFNFEVSMTRATARLAAALIAAALAAPALAQATAPEARRDAVFAQMLAAPADPVLMLEYARLSVRLRDFEAAASTLERLLDLQPDNAAARLELATAYFALGAYEVAEYHRPISSKRPPATATKRRPARIPTRSPDASPSAGARHAGATRTGVSRPRSWTGGSTWAGRTRTNG